MTRKQGLRKGAGRPPAPLTQAGRDAIAMVSMMPLSVRTIIEVQNYRAAGTLPYTEAGELLQGLLKDTHPNPDIDVLMKLAKRLASYLLTLPTGTTFRADFLKDPDPPSAIPRFKLLVGQHCAIRLRIAPNMANMAVPRLDGRLATNPSAALVRGTPTGNPHERAAAADDGNMPRVRVWWSAECALYLYLIIFLRVSLAD